MKLNLLKLLTKKQLLLVKTVIKAVLMNIYSVKV